MTDTENKQAKIPGKVLVIKAEKEGQEPVVSKKFVPHVTADKLAKVVRGLTGEQAYHLKTRGQVEYEDGGWRVTVSIED